MIIITRWNPATKDRFVLPDKQQDDNMTDQIAKQYFADKEVLQSKKDCKHDFDGELFKNESFF